VRDALRAFLDLAARCGHDVTALRDLMSRTRADFTFRELTGRDPKDI
jgi:hypothetical protein